MYSTAYSTTAASSFLTEEIINQLTLAHAEGLLVPVDLAIPSLRALVDRGVAGKMIPPFEHPLLLTTTLSSCWVVDLRPYATRVMSPDGDIQIPEQGPAKLLIDRAKLEMYWNQFSPTEMMFWGDLPFVVFARWIAGLMKGRMQLTSHDIAQVQVISAFYFFCLFYKEEEMDLKRQEGAAMRISRTLAIPVDQAKQWCAQAGYMGTINDFTQKLTEVIDNPSMSMIDAKYVINLTMNSWFGSADARALIAVSLEFPPAFIAMILAAGESSLYRKSTIGQNVDREKTKWRFGEYRRLVIDALKSLR